MNYRNIQSQLEKLLEGDISIDENDLTEKSVDWSLFKIMPNMIVYPKDTRDLQKLVFFVNEFNNTSKEKITLTARAAGSGMSGGSLNHSIIVDVTRYMTEFIKTELGDFGSQTHRGNFSYNIVGKASAQPGMKYIPFEEKLWHEIC